MNLLRFFLMVIVITIVSCVTETPLEPVVLPPQPVDTLSLGEVKIINQEYKLDNNCWAESSVKEQLLQELYLYETGDSALCSWSWDWSAAGQSEVMGFPNISYGKDPWGAGASLCPQLPSRLDLIKKATVQFHISDSSVGKNCTSIANWLVEKEGTEYVIRDEILIRLNGDSIPPVGDLLSPAVTVDGLTASVYKRSAPLNDTVYYSYTICLDVPYLSGEISILNWVTHLITLGLVDNENQTKELSQIQLGSEMWSGSGSVMVHNFSVDCDVTYEPIPLPLDSTSQKDEEIIFHNNCWGASDFEQAIKQEFLLYKESDTLCSWHWDWKDQPTGTIYSYPNLHVGKDVWLTHNHEIAPFPGLLSSVTTLKVDFAFQSNSIGESCNSIAFWMSDDGTVSDLVIFRLDNSTLPPIGDLAAETISLGEQSGKLYSSFIDEGAIAYTNTVIELTSPISSGSIDIKAWCDLLLSQGHITNNSGKKTVDQILLGTETAGGSGDLFVTQFDVESEMTSLTPTYIQHREGPDLHEAYLTFFDKMGIDVILAVETGYAKTDTIMDIVMSRYKHHPSVIGYGVDVEWRTYKPDLPNYGRKVSDEEAQALDSKLKSAYGSDRFRLALKHWDTRWMPPTYRGVDNDMIFINDGQMFPDQQTQVDYFASWCEKYSHNDVLFQIGYEADRPWWKDMQNPVQTIGLAIAEKKTATQNAGMLWVDFSANYPEVSLLDYSETEESKGSPLIAVDFTFPGESPVTMAGLRVTSYGPLYNENPYEFPSVESEKWGYAIRNVQKQFPGSRPVILWAVGHIQGNSCVLEFPKE